MSNNELQIKASPEDVHKRLVSILKSENHTYRSFSEILNKNSLGHTLTYAGIYNILNGIMSPPSYYITLMGLVFGYSPTWILLGIGEKKLTKESSRLITDIQVYRVELANAQAELKAMKLIFEARFDQQDKKIAALERQLKETI